MTEEKDSGSETKQDGGERGFGAEGTAGEEGRSAEASVAEGRQGRAAGDGHSEERALGKVPADVQGDGHPQASGCGVGSRQQHTSLKRDGRGAEEGGSGICSVDGTKEGSGDKDRGPRAYGHGEDAKEVGAKQGFFHDGRGDSERCCGNRKDQG